MKHIYMIPTIKVLEIKSQNALLDVSGDGLNDYGNSANSGDGRAKDGTSWQDKETNSTLPSFNPWDD